MRASRQLIQHIRKLYVSGATSGEITKHFNLCEEDLIEVFDGLISPEERAKVKKAKVPDLPFHENEMMYGEYQPIQPNDLTYPERTLLETHIFSANEKERFDNGDFQRL